MIKNEKEYYSVILGALLHDTGKIINRQKKFLREHHAKCSQEFVNILYSIHPFIQKLVDLEDVNSIVLRHHEDPRIKEEYRVDGEKDGRKRLLCLLVSRADNYSAGERGESEREDAGAVYRKEREKVWLYSVFNRIYKGDEDRGKNLENYLLPLTPLNVDFYKRKKVEIPYEEIIQNLFNDAKKIPQTKIPFHLYFNTIWNLLRRHTSFIPSDTQEDIPDVSLFSHLSTTSAIAACLYQYHAQTTTFSEKEIKNDSLKKFLLVKGTVTPIQKFILNIATTNPKKLSKILRGRSFYITLLAEVLAFYILKECNLPISCLLNSTGGKFTILVPNTDKIKEKIRNIENRILKYFIHNFLYSISPVLDYSIELSGDDFSGKRITEILSTAENSLQSKKFSIRYDNVYFQEVSSEIYQKAEQNRVTNFCPFCGHFFPEKLNEYCSVCKTSEKIGTLLTNKENNFIMFGTNIGGDFKIADIEVKFVSTVETQYLENLICIWRINDEDKISKNYGYIDKFVQNFLPRDRGEISQKKEIEEGSLCFYCSEKCPLISENGDEISRQNLKDQVLTFQCLSAYNYYEDKEKRGVDYLGLLKGDVDNLGWIQKRYFHYPTISRVYTFSFMIEYFFTRVVKEIIKNEFSSVYTIYSGGDDFLFLGPWKNIIKLAFKLREEFKEYTFGNKLLTFSSSGVLFKPHTPLKFAIQDANFYLEKAKSKPDKDSFGTLGVILKWNQFQPLIEFRDKLLRYYEQGLVSRRLLYNLLEFKKMYQRARDYLKAGKFGVEAEESLLYHSRMYYMLTRNVFSKIKDENERRKVEEFFKPLYDFSSDKFLLENIDFAVNWILLKTRRV